MAWEWMDPLVSFIHSCIHSITLSIIMEEYGLKSSPSPALRQGPQHLSLWGFLSDTTLTSPFIKFNLCGPWREQGLQASSEETSKRLTRGESQIAVIELEPKPRGSRMFYRFTCLFLQELPTSLCQPWQCKDMRSTDVGGGRQFQISCCSQSGNLTKMQNAGFYFHP